MGDSSKPEVLELGIEFVVELLLFLYPYGAEQMNLPHNFWLGLTSWIVGGIIAIRMFWIFPIWRKRLSALEKSLMAAIFVAGFVWIFYQPVRIAYGKRNDIPKPEPSVEVTPPKQTSPAASPPVQPIPAAQPPKPQPGNNFVSFPRQASNKLGVRHNPIAPSTNTNYAPNGIANSGTINGSPTVNNYPPARTLSDTQRKSMIAVLSGSAYELSIGSPPSDGEAADYGKAIADTFVAAGWTVDRAFGRSELIGTPMKESLCLSFYAPLGAKSVINVRLKKVVDALTAAGIQVSLNPGSAGTPTEDVFLHVGANR